MMIGPITVRMSRADTRITLMRGARPPKRRPSGRRPALPDTARTPEERVTTTAGPGDDRAWFADTVIALLPDLLATARRLTRNQSDAEDLAADAVARAWTALGSLDDRARVRGWIFRILTNTYISQLRSRGRKPDEEPLPDSDETFSLFERLHQPFLLWWSTPEQEFLDKLLREDFARALDALPDAFRVVVVLADLRGLAYEEIANQLGVPIGTVRSRLARGRARLQKALWVHACDAGLRSSAQPPPAPGA